MIDDAPILNQQKWKPPIVSSGRGSYVKKRSDRRTKPNFPGIWTNGIFASKQAFNSSSHKWLRIRHVQSHQEAHKNKSRKVSISTRITIPFLNSSWRKKSITLVLAMDAQDAAVASYMTVKSHFESIMVSPTAPGSPNIGRPKTIAQA